MIPIGTICRFKAHAGPKSLALYNRLKTAGAQVICPCSLVNRFVVVQDYLDEQQTQVLATLQQGDALTICYINDLIPLRAQI